MPAQAADLSVLDYSAEGKDRYDRCLELVKRDAGTAFDQANGWYKAGGGAAALHCSALALVELKRYPEAAGKLEQAAKEGTKFAAPQRAALLDQAGNAWLLAGKPDRAAASFSAALGFAPQDEDTLTDRARARGLLKDWAGAEADLSAVLSLDPDRADALVLRASAVHAQGRKADARADIAHALDLDPGYPDALLERGAMKLEDGDANGARADWQQVAKDAPGTDAAAAAQVRLQSLKPGK
jgi:regulator of sirC expression with transglutaminase-like and TPR domain